MVAARWLQRFCRRGSVGKFVLCLLLWVGHRIVCGKIAALTRGQLGKWVCSNCPRG